MTLLIYLPYRTPRISLLIPFFLNAEDGIRDGRVTGVQTCALPISARPRARRRGDRGFGQERARCGAEPDRSYRRTFAQARILAGGRSPVRLDGLDRRGATGAGRQDHLNLTAGCGGNAARALRRCPGARGYRTAQVRRVRHRRALAAHLSLYPRANPCTRLVPEDAELERAPCWRPAPGQQLLRRRARGRD